MPVRVAVGTTRQPTLGAFIRGESGDVMASVREEGELGAGIDEVWKLVGDFSGFVEAMGIPVEVSGEGVGSTRTIAMGPSPTVERLETLDNDNRRLQYSLLQGPLPVENYLSTMQLSP